MSIVANEGKNVLVNYNFMLRVEGIYDLPCRSVHSFTKENEFEFVQEGGLNDYVHMLRKPISKPFTFTVERYVGTDLVPPLPLGAELVLPVILMVSPRPNSFGISKRTFVFTGCTVMSKTFGELVAEKSGLLTETIVIGYREMLEVTIPVHPGSDGPLWAFDGKNKDGNKVFSAKRYERENQDEKPPQRFWYLDETRIDTEAGKDNPNRKRRMSAAREKAELPEQRFWYMDESRKDSEEKKKNPNRLRVKSAKRLEAELPKQRFWYMDEKRTDAADDLENPISTYRKRQRSAKTEAATKAEVRKWNMENPDENISAKTLKATEAESRKWSMENPDENTSAKTIEATEVERRKWSMENPDSERSARTEADTDAEGRKWSMKSPESERSARTEADTDAEGRAWSITSPEANRSAKTEPGTKPEGRRWPSISSAKKL